MKMGVQLLLPLGQRFASDILAPEMREHGVDDNESYVLFLTHLERMIHCEDLVVAVVDAATHYAL
jgi:hypothetical protein